MIKLKQNFREELFNTVPEDVVDFWDIKLDKGGVVRTESKTNNINAIYLVICASGSCQRMQWLKFVSSTINDEQKFLIDSVYTKRDLYGPSMGNLDLFNYDEYRYSADENRELIATYIYHNRWIIGESIVSQQKNGEETDYLYGGYENIPDSIKNFDGVELNGETETAFWSDSDGDRHWSFLETSRDTIETFSLNAK